MDKVFIDLKTTEAGLTSEEAKKRLKEYGANILVEKKQTSTLVKFIKHFRDLFGILLL
ncbi:MAG: hypothetical protein GX638_14475, partial [Crenarchaeota archaeon]|nr:hypothetical protein [Thermoproteota archaeon]